MRKRFRHITGTLFIAVLLAGCIREDYEGSDPNLPTRTLLVFLAGDNNLSELNHVAETIRSSWTYTGNRCLIYHDAADAAPVLLSVRGGCKTTPVPYIETVAEYEEENSASAEVFGRVLADVVRMYPADSYGLVYASHATGWLPATTSAIPRNRSVGTDENTGTTGERIGEMELSDFSAAIPDGQFDFIVFETCLMAGVEVAYELRNKTRYILASSAEMLVPGFIPVYPESFGHLMNSGLSVDESLRRLAGNYYRYIDARSGDARSTTLSIIETERMDDLAACVKKIQTRPATPFISSYCDEMQHFDRLYHNGTASVSARYFDLGEYIEKIASRQSYEQFSEIMNETVVWKAATPAFMIYSRNGFAINRHCGLTTYIDHGAYPKLDEAYRQTAWYNATH